MTVGVGVGAGEPVPAAQPVNPTVAKKMTKARAESKRRRRKGTQNMNSPARAVPLPARPHKLNPDVRACAVVLAAMV